MSTYTLKHDRTNISRPTTLQKVQEILDYMNSLDKDDFIAYMINFYINKLQSYDLDDPNHVSKSQAYLINTLFNINIRAVFYEYICSYKKIKFSSTVKWGLSSIYFSSEDRSRPLLEEQIEEFISTCSLEKIEVKFQEENPAYYYYGCDFQTNYDLNNFKIILERANFLGYMISNIRVIYYKELDKMMLSFYLMEKQFVKIGEIDFGEFQIKKTETLTIEQLKNEGI